MSSFFLPGGESKRIALAGAAEIPTQGKTCRVLFSTSAGRLVLVGMPAHYEWKEHAAPNHTLVQVISGQCEIRLDNRAEALNAGDLFYVRPDLAHSITARQPTLLLLSLFRTDEPQPT
ncbi:MAG TPA: AraC family ligand binding domain-containing protein [Clostridia bacterium]|nr:AraC family ligand binding domain-containing protein [Clostridia bacterium]